MFKFPIIMFDDIDTNVGYIMDIAANAKPETVNFMITEAKGLVYVCITKERAKQLGLSLMDENISIPTNKDFTVSVDYKTTTTGISAYERTDTIMAFLDDHTVAKDFRRPGHVFPLISRANGLLERKGIAEAALSFAQMTKNASVAYLCEILNDQGKVAERGEIETFSEDHGLAIISISEIVNMQMERTKWLEVKSAGKVENYPNVSVYEIENKLFTNRFSMYITSSSREEDRIVYYTECTSGDLLGQKRCSCDHHFKEYFAMLIKGKINAVILDRDKTLASANQQEQHLIKQQIKRLINEELQNSHFSSKTEGVNIC